MKLVCKSCDGVGGFDGCTCSVCSGTGLMERAATDEEINAAIELLRGAGWRVERPNLGPWEKPIDLWKRTGTALALAGFYRRLNSFPGDYPTTPGTTGRVVRLRATPELIEWIKRPQQQGKAME